MSKNKIKNYSLMYKIKIIEFYNRNLINKKFSINEILTIFNISNGSLYHWLKLYKSNKLHIKPIYKRTNNKITSVIKCYIRFYVLKRIDFRYKLLIKNIYKKFQVKISKSSIYAILGKMNITRKKVKKRKVYKNTSNLNNKIKQLRKKIKHINKDNIICIDESSFDTNICNDYGWSKKGVRITKNINSVRTRYTVISAISNKKIIHIKIIKNSANRIIFLDFLKELINKNINNKYLFMDNARIHKAQIIREFEKKISNKYLYNIPYNSEFNPIEHVFSQVKNIVWGKKDNDKMLKKNICKAFDKVRQRDLKNYYKI